MNEIRGYGESQEELMRLYCGSLPEGHRGHYAAVEALKIALGGVSRFSCSPGPGDESANDLHWDS
jgi:hypothetical protein